MDKPTIHYIRETGNRCSRMYAEGRLRDLWDLLSRAARYFGERDCIVEIRGNTTAAHTTGAFYDDVCALGAALQKAGFAGKHIAVLGENSYDWLTAFLAVTCSGNVAVPLDKELTAREITLLCRKAECAMAFCSVSCLGKLVQTGIPCVTFAQEGEQTIGAWKRRGAEALDAQEPLPGMAARGEDVAAILFTSGTTGTNKGVQLTHRNFVSNVEGVIETNDAVYSVLSVLPMNHAYELGSSILPHLYSGTVIYLNDSLRRFFANVRTYQPEYLAVVPLFAEDIRRRILREAEEAGTLDDLYARIEHSRRLMAQGVDERETLFAREREAFGYMFPYLACGGAPLKPETASFLDALGFKLLLGYGLTETSPIVSLNREAGQYPDSVGVPFPGVRVQIHRPDADGVGEVWVSGDNVSPGYYKDPRADRRSFRRGWFRTGDYGRIGASGELYLTGRKKNLILLPNGKNVFPEELEYYFCSRMEAIRDAVVFESARGADGQDETAILVLAVSLREDVLQRVSAADIREEIRSYNRELPGYKRVHDVYISDASFPRTSTKKIIRKAVKEQYESKRKADADIPKV